MCLAIPGKIEHITDLDHGIFRSGLVAFGDIRKEVNLSMVPDATEDDYVLVHVGVAISIIDEDEAKKTFELLETLGETNELRSE